LTGKNRRGGAVLCHLISEKGEREPRNDNVDSKARGRKGEGTSKKRCCRKRATLYSKRHMVVKTKLHPESRKNRENPHVSRSGTKSVWEGDFEAKEIDQEEKAADPRMRKVRGHVSVRTWRIAKPSLTKAGGVKLD